MTMGESPSARNQEREFGELNREFQRKQREFREDLNQRRNEELARHGGAGEPRIRQIAEQEKFDIIFQEAVYASPRIDITDKVIKALDDKPPAKISGAVARAMPQARSRSREIVSRLGGRVARRPARRGSARSARCERAAAARSRFSSRRSYRAELAATRAAAVILAPENERDATALPRIVCRRSYAYFARVSQLFNPPPPVIAGVHPAAVVAPAARSPRPRASRPVRRRARRRGRRTRLARRGLRGRAKGRSIGDDSCLYPRVVVYPAASSGRARSSIPAR